MFKIVFTLVLLNIALAGYMDDCWSKCGSKPGRCDECGGTYGYCCKVGDTRNECNGFDGCTDYHCCKLGDCWSNCNQKSGPCAACGHQKACCRKGYNKGGASCNFGDGGCTGYHCCDMDYCLQGDINDKYEVQSIHYDVQDGVVAERPPKIAGQVHVNALSTSSEQSATFSATETYTETKSFSHTAGASVTVGTEFKVGVPLIASGSVSVEVSASYEFSYGEEHSVERSTTQEYNCNAAPGKYVECTVTYHEFTATVPYTATWRRKDDHSCVRTSSGVFTEVSAFKMHLQVVERDHAMRIVKRTTIPLE